MSGYKTRSARPYLATPYDNPERQFRKKKRNNTPISIHNLFSFCDPSDSDTEVNDEINIDSMTMKQYMDRNNEEYDRGVNSEPETVKFDIKGQIIEEEQDRQFSIESDEEDAQEHVEEVLYIASTYGSAHVFTYKLMPKIFPISLTGQARKWFNRLPRESKATWENLRRAFIQRFCPPTKLAASLREIYRFVQIREETLYQAWERYNELLYRCPTHGLNNQMKVFVFYRGLDEYTRNILDSQRPIPGLTPEKAFQAIQRTAEHVHKWHLETGYGPKENFKHKVMKTLAKNDGGYAAEFERARKERNEAEKSRQSEEVKSLVGRSRDNNLEETVQRYIAESMKRQEREEEMLRNLVESTISSLKAHDIGIRNLELKIEQCTNVVKECLKMDTSSHVEPSPEETQVIAAEEIEPKTFSEKVKMRIEKEQLLLEELESLPINAPLVKSIKTKTCNLKHLQGFLEAKDKLEGVNSDQDEFYLDKFLDGDEIQGAPLSNNDSSLIENFDVFIDFEESGHGIGMDDGTGHHEINSMDVIPPRMDEEDALDPQTQPSLRETGIRIHHSNPLSL
ncbi:hypothetical protein CTI12_AA065090 [Artemisia annua]|uniref:Retrotransposon gag domain-containing protein n=1 Tax=Artemisia annua TaxID=35608 RepID=A0A2U1PJR4_ARTAN|nr:hypothetical protein CTI12_AA065090 [Artemisia annua]